MDFDGPVVLDDVDLFDILADEFHISAEVVDIDSGVWRQVTL